MEQKPIDPVLKSLAYNFLSKIETFMRKEKHTRAKKKVICRNTGDIFESQTEAAEWIKANGLNMQDINRNSLRSTISLCCSFKIKSAGIGKDGKELVWRFYKHAEK